VVQPGETVARVANRYGITPWTLIAANDLYLQGNRLRPGQQLRIPRSKTLFEALLKEERGNVPVAIYHRIRRGETLISIARRYGVTVRQLRQWNGLRSNRIIAGKKLIIYLPRASRVAWRSKSSHQRSTASPSTTALKVVWDNTRTNSEVQPAGSVLSNLSRTGFESAHHPHCFQYRTITPLPSSEAWRNAEWYCTAIWRYH